MGADQATTISRDARRARAEIFVDFDGTITDADTFDVLVRRLAGDAEWLRIEALLDAGEMTLRAALDHEASLVRLSLDDAVALLDREIGFDEGFGRFVAEATARGDAVTVVSSGCEPVISRRLARHGVRVPVVANGLDPRPEGWVIRFRDAVDNGTDKAAIVRAARERGSHTVFIGDGRSDLDALIEADRRFVRRGKIAERVLAERAIPHEPFGGFDEIARALEAFSG